MRTYLIAAFLSFAAALHSSNIAVVASGPYSFINIADNTGPLTELRNPRINNNGTVCFRAQTDTGGEGIFTGDGAALTTIADTNTEFGGHPLNGFFWATDINDQGKVAFYASAHFTNADDKPDGHSYVFVSGPGGPLNVVYDIEDYVDGMSINNAGAVTFVAGGAPSLQVVLADGVSVSTIANVGQYVARPSINDNGTVAFYLANQGALAVGNSQGVNVLYHAASLFTGLFGTLGIHRSITMA